MVDCIIPVQQLKQSQASKVASNTEEYVGGESRVEIADNRQFEDVFMMFVNSPRLEAKVAIHECVMEGENLDGGHATQTVQVAGGKLLRRSSVFVPYQ